MKTTMPGSGPTLIDERLREVEGAAQLTEAEEWQRAQAWAT